MVPPFPLTTLQQHTMSFAISQLIAMTTAELEQLNSLSSKDAAANNRIRSLTKELSNLNKQLAAAEASKPKPAEPKPAEDEADAPKDVFLSCRDCKSEFCFSVEEQFKYWQRDWSDPVRCDACRQERKANRIEPLTVKCCDCEAEFTVSAGRQKFIAEMGHVMPKRCSDCQQAAKAKRENGPKPILINCGTCHKDFSFSVGAQKHHAENKWADPKFCKPCRDLRKAKAETRSTKSSKVSA